MTEDDRAGISLDGGRKGPERSCILTRAVRPQDELMRFVLGPDGAVVPDLRRRLPGRGAWLTPTAAALGEAVRKRLFSRAFKREARAEQQHAAPSGHGDELASK